MSVPPFFLEAPCAYFREYFSFLLTEGDFFGIL